MWVFPSVSQFVYLLRFSWLANVLFLNILDLLNTYYVILVDNQQMVTYIFVVRNNRFAFAFNLD